jgi:hypothetical protein
MQALCLATCLIFLRLEDFLSKEGRVFDAEDDSEWDLRSVMVTFGQVRSRTPHNRPLQWTGGSVALRAPSRARR